MSVLLQHRRADEVLGRTVGVVRGGEGSASDEPHPTEENRRADEGGHWNG